MGKMYKKTINKKWYSIKDLEFLIEYLGSQKRKDLEFIENRKDIKRAKSKNKKLSQQISKLKSALKLIKKAKKSIKNDFLAYKDGKFKFIDNDNQEIILEKEDLFEIF